jgi:hypothetical protein
MCSGRVMTIGAEGGMSRPQTFMEWLVRQAYRDDAVGDIARDLMEDPQTLWGVEKLADFRAYLMSFNASQQALAALDQAWREWTS